MKNIKIAIIGGGCSGLFLANLLNDKNVDLYLFEKNNKLGKKILASGNGKCNFTNISDLSDKYNNVFANEIIDQYTVEETLNKFQSLGLIYKNDEQGRCYPVSECASSVLDCLKMNLKNVHILLESVVKKIERTDKGYLLQYNDAEEIFDYVICCSGSCASNLGSNKAYDYLNQLNLEFDKMNPSLVPVRVKEKISELKGVRVKCNVKLLDEFNKQIYEEDGEVLFKEDALSGIAIFNISSYVNRNNGKYKIVLDLSNGMKKNELINYLKIKSYQPTQNIFKGFLNDKIAQYILNLNKVYNIENLVNQIYQLTFNVTGLYPFIDSQVCNGGVSLDEMKETLELKKYPKIYVAGELLNIDGVSGGYNMQFAWSSAGTIAKDIIKKLQVSN